MYHKYTQANCSRKDIEMQEQEKEEMNEDVKELFAGACMFPCRLLAEVIEMEHRANGEDYEELLDTAAKQLTGAIQVQKVVPDTILADESVKLEVIGLLYGMSTDAVVELIMPGLEAKMANMKEGDPDVM